MTENICLIIESRIIELWPKGGHVEEKARRNKNLIVI